MKRSTERILTTHVGSLARPVDLLDLMKAKVNDEPYDEQVYAERIPSAVVDIVRQQVECGIDVVTDGEQSKLGFSSYVGERLVGYEARPGTIDKDEFSEELVLRALFRRGDARRCGYKDRSGSLHRADQLQGSRCSESGYRQSQSGRSGRGEGGCIHARGSARRRGLQ